MGKISARWLALAVLFAWTLLPAIACAADMSQMSEPEMACCKKMAGKCDMGAGQHSCCDQTVHSQDPTRAVVTQTFQLHHLHLFSRVVLVDGRDNLLTGRSQLISDDASPPESPPASITVLRI